MHEQTQISKAEYVPTPKELEGNAYGYCYLQADVWMTRDLMPFVSKPEEPHEHHQ